MSTIRQRLNEVPVYQRSLAQLDAANFNRAKLALIRKGSPIRFGLPHLRGLELELDHEFWACVDRTLNDLPVVVWSDFQTQGRNNLHKPIACQLRFYHAHASMIVETILKDLDDQVRELLKVRR